MDIIIIIITITIIDTIACVHNRYDHLSISLSLIDIYKLPSLYYHITL